MSRLIRWMMVLTLTGGMALGRAAPVTLGFDEFDASAGDVPIGALS